MRIWSAGSLCPRRASRFDKQVTLEQYKRAYRDIILSEQRTGCYIHATVYAIVNALLVTMNLYFVPSVLWFYFPLLSWRIRLAVHYIGVTRLAPRDLVRKEAEAECRAKSRGALTR